MHSGNQMWRLRLSIRSRTTNMPSSDPTTPPHKRYGQGFYISPAWIPHYWGGKRINDRISIIQFMLNKITDRSALLTIINVYGPTAMLTQKDPTIRNSFYDSLQQTYSLYKSRSSIVIVAGDFNSKIGEHRGADESFI